MRAISVIAIALSVLFPRAASAQWLPANASDTDAISHTGNVGIGRSPFAAFSMTVSGNTSTVNTGIFFHNNSNTTFELSEASNNNSGVHLWNYKNSYVRFGANNQEVMRLTPEGHVGIGTGAPNYLSFTNSRVLTVSSGAGSGRGVIEIGSDNDAGSHITGVVTFFNKSAGAGRKESAAIHASADASGTANDRGYSLTFLTKADQVGAVAERMKVNVSGIAVTGNGSFTGTVTGSNIQAQYQDLAEWVPAGEELEPGSVVVLDPNVSNQVLASTRAYDTTVAGVVSKQPGIILGERGRSKEQIATTGRVRMRVDATAAPIRIGDLLVTSDKRGTAMRSKAVDVGGIAMHRPGTVIGKALEPLANGTGEILVLLSLQ